MTTYSSPTSRVSVHNALRSDSAFANAVAAAASRKVATVLNGIKDDLEREANALVRAELVTDRPPARRKRGARKLEGSMVAVVEFDGTFPINVSLTSRAERRKVAALEFGSPPHSIWAVNKPLLVFPSTQGRAAEFGAKGKRHFLQPASRTKAYAAGSNRRQLQAYGRSGSGVIRTPHVYHPGNQPYHFLQRAMDKVIRRALSQMR